jgi:hypothetical protein
MFLLLNPATDGGVAVNELRMHIKALSSLLLIETRIFLVNMGASMVVT